MGRAVQLVADLIERLAAKGVSNEFGPGGTEGRYQVSWRARDGRPASAEAFDGARALRLRWGGLEREVDPGTAVEMTLAKAVS